MAPLTGVRVGENCRYARGDVLERGPGFRFGQTRIAYEFGFRQRVDQKQR